MPHRRQVVSGVLVQLGDVEVGFRVVRVHGDRLGIRGERFLEPALVLEGDSEIVCRRGVVRCHGEDDAVVLDGLGGLSQGMQQAGEIDPGVVMCRIERHRAAVRLPRFGGAVWLQHAAAFEPRIGGFTVGFPLVDPVGVDERDVHVFGGEIEHYLPGLHIPHRCSVMGNDAVARRHEPNLGEGSVGWMNAPEFT